MVEDSSVSSGNQACENLQTTATEAMGTLPYHTCQPKLRLRKPQFVKKVEKRHIIRENKMQDALQENKGKLIKLNEGTMVKMQWQFQKYEN